MPNGSLGGASDAVRAPCEYLAQPGLWSQLTHQAQGGARSTPTQTMAPEQCPYACKYWMPCRYSPLLHSHPSCFPMSFAGRAEYQVWASHGSHCILCSREDCPTIVQRNCPQVGWQPPRAGFETTLCLWLNSHHHLYTSTPACLVQASA